MCTLVWLFEERKVKEERKKKKRRKKKVKIAGKEGSLIFDQFYVKER